MPLNESLVGKVYPAVSFAVEEGRVKLFDAAIGETGEFVPPTFATAPELAALAQVVGEDELGLDFTRVVHAEQEYEWRRPLAIGDVIAVTSRISSVRSKGGLEFLEVESALRDVDGELVILARNTLVSRGPGRDG